MVVVTSVGRGRGSRVRQAIGRGAIGEVVHSPVFVPVIQPSVVFDISRSMMPQAVSPGVEARGSSPEAVRGVEGSTAECLLVPPSCPPSEDRRFETSGPGGSRTVGKGGVAGQGDMVEPEIPDGGVDHAVRRDGKGRPNDGPGDAVIPVVEFVNGQCTGDQGRAEHRGVEGDQFPKGRVVVAEHLHLRVQVEEEVQEPRPRSGAVARRHGFKRVVNLVDVASANVALEHDSPEALTALGGDLGRVRVADGEEVRSETANQPFDKDLEDCGTDEGVEKTDDGVVAVPEGPNAGLHAEDDENRDQRGQEGREPDGHDFMAQRVGELRVDNLSVSECDWEGSAWSRLRFVDSQTNGTHGRHGEQVQPCEFQPGNMSISCHSFRPSGRGGSLLTIDQSLVSD